jgi:hypothetical protein
MKKINCLFASRKSKKYIVLDGFRQIGFAHLRDLTAFLDDKFGKGNYSIQFNFYA